MACGRALGVALIPLVMVGGCSKPDAGPTGKSGVPRAPIAASPPSTTAAVEEPRSEPIRFNDVSRNAGLTVAHLEADDGRFRLIETMGSGVGLIDYDGDGRLDLYIGQGGEIPPDLKNPRWASRLYHNDGNGKFTDVTEQTHAGFGRYAQGISVGDYDGDGRDDLFVAGFGKSALYRNVDGKTFEDVTDKAGVGGSGWATSCGFADFDRDGDLDLFVVRYLANTVDEKGEPTVRCNGSPGKLGYCPPNAFSAESSFVYRNNGDGTFTDMSKQSGIASAKGHGLGLAIADFDDDGDLDVFVANDQMPNFLFQNQGNWTFDEVGLAWGVALSENGQTRAGMGVAAGDADGDGLIDLCVTNFYEEGATLYHNLGQGRFQVATAASRLLVPTRSKLGFGTVFLDADNDGVLDLFMANGHINDVTPVGMPYRMEPQLFQNRGAGRFADVSQTAGAYFQGKHLARSATFGDIDNDGDTDLLISHLQTPPALLLNETKGGHWVRLTLIGAGKSRSAIGAKVTAEIGERKLTRWVVGGSSYLASTDPRILFGLGADTKINRLTIQWPSGKVQEIGPVEADRAITVTEGQKP